MLVYSCASNIKLKYHKTFIDVHLLQSLHFLLVDFQEEGHVENGIWIKLKLLWHLILKILQQQPPSTDSNTDKIVIMTKLVINSP